MDTEEDTTVDRGEWSDDDGGEDIGEAVEETVSGTAASAATAQSTTPPVLQPKSVQQPRQKQTLAPPSVKSVARPRLRKPAPRHIQNLDDDEEGGEELPPVRPKRPPVQVVQGKQKSFLATAGPAICLIVGLLMIGVVILAKLDFGTEPVKKMPSMFYELTDNVWPKQCTPVTMEEVKSGKVNILSKEVKLADLRESLIHHIEEKGEQGLCAQNLEKKTSCYCILATGSTSQPYLEMYNMIMMGDSYPNMEFIPEENTFCKHPVEKLRYNHVTVRFQTPNGSPDRQRFEAPEAYVIQAFDDMLRGVSRCEDTKEQLMMHDIHDGVRYLSREQIYKEYGHMIRAYPEGLLPDVQMDDRRGRRTLPASSSDK